MVNSKKYYCTAYQHDPSDIPDENEEVWTVSIDPNAEGWNTDGGYNGYGLKKSEAQFLADAANEKLEREQNASLVGPLGND